MDDKDEIIQVKRSAKGIFKNFSILLAIAAMVVLIALVFADVSFVPTFSVRWAIKLVFYLLMMYILFFSMQSTGVQDGHVQDSYIEVKGKYDELRESIRSDSELEDLQDFCDEYIVKELKHARTKVLRAASIPYPMFEAEWLDNENPLPKTISRKKRLAIVIARRLKPVVLTPDMLLNCGSLKPGRAPLGASPSAMLMRRTLVKMLPRTAMTFLVTDFAVSVITNPTWETLITGIMMCFVGVLCAYEGYESGFKNIVDDTVRYVDRQVNVLSQYVIWLGKREENDEKQAERADRPSNAGAGAEAARGRKLLG